MLPDIGLIGLAQSGKDTVARILVDEYGYHRVAFADTLKDVALGADPVVDRAYRLRLSDIVDLDGWEAAKREPEVRRFLQDLGVAVRDHVGPDTWVRAAMDKATALGNAGHPCVFTDARFHNEAKAIRCDLGGFLVRVRRPRSVGGLIPELAAHLSETELADCPTQYTIVNSDTMDNLHAEVVRTVGRISLLEPA